MKASFLLHFFLFATVVSAQTTNDLESCSIDVIREMKAEPSEDTILNFLTTYKEDCNNDAEFSPAANWHLFYILNNYPELTLRTLTKAESELNFELGYIIENFKYPVTEDIDVKSIYEKIQKLPTSELRTRILGNLKFQL